jgi:hypothetical protein
MIDHQTGRMIGVIANGYGPGNRPGESATIAVSEGDSNGRKDRRD